MKKAIKMLKVSELPIGFSDIERVIRTGYYVDKTRYAQMLIEGGNPVFIGRPRRFGKSLFIDTLATICSGKKEIFEDCYIGQAESGYEWKKYPIICLDFSELTNGTPEELKESIIEALKEIGTQYGVEIKTNTLKGALKDLVRKLADLSRPSDAVRSSHYESKIIVLIDEYDAPIVNLSRESDLEERNIKVMRDFFTALKALGRYCQLTFVTGVSRYSLSDVHSGANNLIDMTIHASAAAMFCWRLMI